MKKVVRLTALRGSRVMVLALLTIGLWVTPVSATEYGGIGGRPASPDASNSRTESIFVFSLDPGSQAKNAVRVYNSTSEKKTIEVYPVDSQSSSGGAFACAQRADERRAVGSWMRLEKESVTLDPGGAETVPFTLTVPSGTAAGEHNGCIAIQEGGQTPQSAGNGITLSFRSAIRVAVTVTGDIKKDLAFTRLQSTSAGDKRRINVALRNNGNVSLDTLIDIQLKSVFGAAVEQTSGEFPVLTGGESEFNFDINEPFWGGMYVLNATARYNADPTASLGHGNKDSGASQAEVLFITPKPMAAFIELIILIALVGGLAAWIRRIRLHRRWRKKGAQHVVKEGDTIQTLAKTYKTSWKTIARVNKLKPPYELTAGQTLWLPKHAHPAHQKTTKKSSHHLRL